MCPLTHWVPFLDGCALFRAFLAREYSEENVEFWIACEEYRSKNRSKRQMVHKAKKIFDQFLAVRAPKEVRGPRFDQTIHTESVFQVNIESSLRADVQASLSPPTTSTSHSNVPNKSLFDEVQRKIQSMLESDSYVRFLQSDLYQDLVKSEQERKSQEEREQQEDRESSSKKS